MRTYTDTDKRGVGRFLEIVPDWKTTIRITTDTVSVLIRTYFYGCSIRTSTYVFIRLDLFSKNPPCNPRILTSADVFSFDPDWKRGLYLHSAFHLALPGGGGGDGSAGLRDSFSVRSSMNDGLKTWSRFGFGSLVVSMSFGLGFIRKMRFRSSSSDQARAT